MNIEVIADGSYRRTLQIVVPASTVDKQLDHAYREVGRQAKLKGFRPGKTPQKVLENRFGPQIASDVAADLIQEAYSAAIEQHELQPVSRPSVDREEQPRRGVDFAFTISVEVRPSVELQTWTGVDVVYPSAEVSEAELQGAIARRLVDNKRLVAVSDRPVGADDQVMVELHAFDGDTEVATEPGTMIRTAGDTYYKGVESLVVGLAEGEEREGEVRFAADARVEAVAGRTLRVRVKVVSIQTFQIPELTDDLAEELGFEGGADGMKLALRAELQAGRDDLARNQARANLLQALIDANTFDVPPGMVDQQLDILLNELRLQQAYRGIDPRQVHFSPAQIADLRMRSEFAVKGGLILEFVAKHESIEVSDDDVERKYQELADERGQDVSVIRSYFESRGEVDELRERLLEEKSLDWLLERANIVAPPEPAPEPGTADDGPVADDDTDAPGTADDEG
jgi:trigger factor